MGEASPPGTALSPDTAARPGTRPPRRVEQRRVAGTAGEGGASRGAGPRPDDGYGSLAEVVGARVWFQGDDVWLTPAAPLASLASDPRLVPCMVSLISPGAELRSWRSSKPAYRRPAGQAAIAWRAGRVLLAPAPHGAGVDPLGERTLSADCTVPVAAAARFQLIAALGLRRLRPPSPGQRRPGEGARSGGGMLPSGNGPAVVIGSGPVALGAVLELIRLGVREVLVWSRREWPAVTGLPGVSVLPDLSRAGAALVVECTGRRVADALDAAAPGATIGLLGAPGTTDTVSAPRVHGAGLRLVGMREPTGLPHRERRETYAALAGWLTTEVGPARIAAWCHATPGERAVELYRALRDGDRPRPPLLLLDWRR